MMPRYAVEWSLQGETTVEAADEKEARRKILIDLPDEDISEDITDMDVGDVTLEEGGDSR